MIHLTRVGKFTALLFSAVFLVACAGTDTKDEGTPDVVAGGMSEAEMAAKKREEAIAAATTRVNQVGSIFYFEFDSSALTQDSIEKLNAHIALLQLVGDRNIRLEGHADERGTREYNMALGERRANSVRDYMVANGIGTYRVETVSYGEEKPVAYGAGEANWSQNRRVELK